MTYTKNILVTTTSTLENVIVKQYLKPVSAHIVAGTNLFSDFAASFNDIFGGRSQTYQKQLSSLYNEAIERLKIAANEIGANCILGLTIDMDEIAGKGKSMFMVTAIGTAVIIDDQNSKIVNLKDDKKLENVGVDKIKAAKQKREIINKANQSTLKLDDETWDFITLNQVSEVYDYILSKLRQTISAASDIDNPWEKYYKRTIVYLDSFSEEKKFSMLYESILNEENEKLAVKLCAIVGELQLLDFDLAKKVIEADNFQKQKAGLRLVSFDKSFYNKHDIDKINSIITIIKNGFPERGIRSMKKQLLSSKEKEVWTCECKSINDVGTLCVNCDKDIFGFKQNETSPIKAISDLEEKISLINEFVE